ncbi:hypothetical protein [Streptomyces sp. NPDC093707]|uniref:hypothetical protein n=1 Tax=Streptomyces sp. NPDC093707 TaxID=3154984 RepID=UPI00344CFAE5
MDQLTLDVLEFLGCLSILFAVGAKLAADLDMFLKSWRRPICRIRSWRLSTRDATQRVEECDEAHRPAPDERVESNGPRPTPPGSHQ